MSRAISLQRQVDVLLAIMNGTEVSRHSLARRTGVSFPTVSRILDGFQKRGVVTEVGKLARVRQAGPRPRILQVKPDLGLSVGVDVEGFAVRAVALDCANQVTHSRHFPLEPADGAEGAWSAVKAALSYLLKATPKDRVFGIGLALPGGADPMSGAIRRWTGYPDSPTVPFATRCKETFGLPVAVLKNVQAMALAETRSGLAGDSALMGAVVARFGIAGAVVVRGTPLDARRSEIGHTVIRENGRRCLCGKRGCLEAYAGGWALARRFARREKDAASQLRLSAAYWDFCAALDQNDSLARRILMRGCRHLATGIANFQYTLGLDTIVLFGVYNRLGNEAAYTIKESLRLNDAEDVRVLVAESSEFRGSVGAAMYARDLHAASFFGRCLAGKRRISTPMA